ncbi:MAG: LysM peptidoglycan-binding domain-containing protein [Anaerolineae bacterium]|nr:LysM peptidoglycan-binding domain-containing protein [Anaerolineae bacterium]
MDIETILHTIRLGERLGQIAASYRTDIQTLFALNPALESDRHFRSDLTLGATEYSVNRTLRVPRPLEAVAPEPYIVRTEDDLLRRMWETAWERDPNTYDRDAADTLFKTSLQGLVLTLQSADEQMRASLEQLSLARTRALYEQQAEAAYSELYRFWGGDDYEEYLRFYRDAQVLESGRMPPEARHADFQTDLALTDYFQQQFGTRDRNAVEAQIFDLAVELVARQAVDSSVFGLSETASADEIRAALKARVGENATLEELFAFLEEITQLGSSWIGDSFPELPEYYESIPHSDELYAQYRTQEALDALAGYHEAKALDQLRQIVYDPTWNPEEDAYYFPLLSAAIQAMPGTLMGVGIGFAKDGLQAYHDQMLAFHTWRLEMKIHLDRVEAMMLERQGEEQASLWWLLEIPLSILVEPLDWLFTIRDLLKGEWSALIGLLPLVPSALRHIVDAANYARVTLPSTIRQFVDDAAVLYAGAFRPGTGINEVPSQNMVAQIEANYCVPACLSQLLADRGVALSQADLARMLNTTVEYGTEIPGDIRTLDKSQQLGVRLSSHPIWTYLPSLNTLDYHVPTVAEEIGQLLDRRGSFIARVNRHAIIVDEVLETNGSYFVKVRDPLGLPGTSVGSEYMLSASEFLQLVVNGQYWIILVG